MGENILKADGINKILGKFSGNLEASINIFREKGWMGASEGEKGWAPKSHFTPCLKYIVP